jgi:hypothetical protein
MWELRKNFSAYDATYVALAEAIAVNSGTPSSALGGSNRTRGRYRLDDLARGGPPPEESLTPSLREPSGGDFESEDGPNPR